MAEGERQGRPAQKFYLYDIVNNSRSGLDVDKLDYFQRDIHHSNVDTNYNHFQRFFEFGRVLKAEPIHSSSSTSNVPYYFDIASPIAERPSSLSCAYMICYPEKMVGEVLQLFALRYQLHQKVYTHKSIKKVEYMLVDALELADPHIVIPGSKTESHPSGQYRMSECYLDPAALCNLKDSVIYLIEISTSPELEEARRILERIRRRQFYSCMGKTVYQRGSRIDSYSPEEIANSIVELANTSLAKEKFEETSNSTSTPDLNPLEVGSREDDDDSGGFDFIQSQDSFAPWIKRPPVVSQEDRAAFSQGESDLIVTTVDIIVEKMHIHYGMKNENPVDRLRFYPKDVPLETCVAKKIKESSYSTLLPRAFKELAVRVFCRNQEKDRILLKAFQDWCRECYASSPFPSQSQA